jgi:hypothetical protein
MGSDVPIDLIQYMVPRIQFWVLYSFEQWPSYSLTALNSYLKGGRVAEGTRWITAGRTAANHPLSSHSFLKWSKQEMDSSNGPPRTVQVKGQLPRTAIAFSVLPSTAREQQIDNTR